MKCEHAWFLFRWPDDQGNDVLRRGCRLCGKAMEVMGKAKGRG